MASKSNMQPSLVKKTFKTLDPYPRPCPTESFVVTCNPNTAIPSCSFAQLISPNKFPSKPLVLKHSSIELVNKELKDLIQKKLIYHVLNGRPTDTLDYHRHKLIDELIQWIQPSQNILDTYDSSYRDQLMTLLSSASKQNVKDIPLDESEWLKLLNQWIRKSSNEDIIFNRDIFQILAVDGFLGFRPKDLKQYLTNILIPLRSEFKMHAKGVRAMYEFFDQNSNIESLSGTDSACSIFLALLDLYANLLKKLLLDDQVRFQVQQSKSWAEGFLHKHSDYYHDVKHVDEILLKSLANVYSEQFTDKKKMKHIGRELLKNLNVLCDQKFK